MATKLRIQAPELEYDVFSGFMRYLEHGFPNPLVRWHYHEAYELHLIVDTRGKIFVGDYVGEFEPGNLVLVGPRQPHNWISTEYAAEGVPLRDMVVQFMGESIVSAAKGMPELQDILPLLERAKYGVEFFGLHETARESMTRIRDLDGIERLAELLRLLGGCARSTSYRLLSSARIEAFDDADALDKINTIVNYVAEHYSHALSADHLAEMVGMSPSKFSRFFRKGTGNCFTEFVNRIRVNKACHLLMNTNHQVTSICYDVGFNNVANFNRRFLELKGMTPKEFRRTCGARFGE